MIPGDDLKNGAKELLITGLYSDLTIKCGEKEFKVHRTILHPQSSYFRKLFAGGFKESVEKQSIITFHDDPAVFQAFIHYLYFFEWDDTAHGSGSAATFAVYVYQLADKYDVEPLRHMAANRFHDTCDPKNDPKGFVEAIYAIYECTNPTDRQLWGYALPLMKKHMSHLLQQDEFKTLLKEKDDLKFKLLEHMSSDIVEADWSNVQFRQELGGDFDNPFARLAPQLVRPSLLLDGDSD